MSNPRQIYLLDPQKIKPETIAVTFAKTSRSPLSFRQIAAELSDEKSARFHEKWVVGYGHASVAEHAVLHIAVENISRLAVEALESNRLASYTEKSTRYQTWDTDNFFIPPELEEHPLRERYMGVCRRLFEAYRQSIPRVKSVISQLHPRREDENPEQYDRRVRSKYVDICRYYLPSAALANVGVTINARAMEYALQKMFSHPLQEVQETAAGIKAVAQNEVPTLVKYADATPYLENACREMTLSAASLPPSPPGGWCTLTDFDPDGDERILAAALYRFSNTAYKNCLQHVKGISEKERAALAAKLVSTLGEHDTPLREFEYSRYTFDLVMDQGAYFEFKRHRMMTQTPQPLSTELGYAMPRLIVAAGIEQEFRAAMDSAGAAYRELASFNPAVASYLVPNAFNRRVLATMNLRSAIHLLKLRSAPNAHFAMRRVAQRMAEHIRSVTPLLAASLPRSDNVTWQSIETDYFAQV